MTLRSKGPLQLVHSVEIADSPVDRDGREVFRYLGGAAIGEAIPEGDKSHSFGVNKLAGSLMAVESIEQALLQSGHPEYFEISQRSKLEFDYNHREIASDGYDHLMVIAMVRGDVYGFIRHQGEPGRTMSVSMLPFGNRKLNPMGGQYTRPWELASIDLGALAHSRQDTLVKEIEGLQVEFNANGNICVWPSDQNATGVMIGGSQTLANLAASNVFGAEKFTQELKYNPSTWTDPMRP